MATVTEGALTFNFPREWTAVKYDETRFYRNSVQPLGADLKAVDIIAIPPESPVLRRELFLIEIKDFRGHAPENRRRKSSGELIIEVIGKAMHTIACLYCATRTEDPEFRAVSEVLLRPPEMLNLVLFMQEDAPRTKLEQVNQQKMREDLLLKYRSKLRKNGFEFRILDIAALRDRDGWSAV